MKTTWESGIEMETREKRTRKREEKWCWICYRGGACLIHCGQEECGKVYHPGCVGKDDLMANSGELWICYAHSCFICNRDSSFNCTGCTKALCKQCIGGAEFVQIKGNKGLCNVCLKYGLLVEESVADYDMEFMVHFRKAWKILGEKECLSLEDLRSAKYRMITGDQIVQDLTAGSVKTERDITEPGIAETVEQEKAEDSTEKSTEVSGQNSEMERKKQRLRALQREKALGKQPSILVGKGTGALSTTDLTNDGQGVQNRSFKEVLDHSLRLLGDLPVFPQMCSIQTEDLPPHIKDKVLYFVLQKRSLEQLYAFQKIYIRRYSLSEGPLTNLPLHPKYPFLTILVINGRFRFYFPKEAYIFLWYFVETCPFGMIFDKTDLFHCLSMADMRPCKRKYKQLYKWLTLFGNTAFWHENLKPEGKSANGVRDQRYILIVFDCQRTITIEEDGLAIQRKYSCTFCHDAIYDTNWPTEEHKALICAINNVQVDTVPPGLPEAYWKKPNILPLDYVTTIQDCQFKLNLEAITTEWDDPDHPDFRLHKRNPPRFYKYLPGLKYSVPMSSESEEEEEVEPIKNISGEIDPIKDFRMEHCDKS